MRFGSIVWRPHQLLKFNWFKEEAGLPAPLVIGVGLIGFMRDTVPTRATRVKVGERFQGVVFFDAASFADLEN